MERNVLLGYLQLGDWDIVPNDEVSNGSPLLCAAIPTKIDVVDRTGVKCFIEYNFFLYPSALDRLLVVADDVGFVHDGLLEPRVTKD